MLNCLAALLTLLLPIQGTYLANVSGHILDTEGKPLAGAQVVYQRIGTYARNYSAGDGMRTESPQMTEGTGRVYRTKTNKKGEFTLAGMDYGVYEIQITGPDGAHVYSGKKTIGHPDDPGSQNTLNVDLSTVYNGPLEPGGGTNLAAGKKNKEQLDLIREENARAAKINKLVYQYHQALALEEWQNAITRLKELIVIDPHRWEFYQNLGTLQANQGLYQEGAQTFAQGVEVARKTLSNPTDTDHALTTIGDLLLAEADCYMRMGNIDDAVTNYDKAAAVHPRPFMARYRACSALNGLGKSDAAIERCNQAVADDPEQWGPYQMLGSIFSSLAKPKDALDAYGKGVAAAQKALAVKPDNPQIKSGLGQMLNSKGNLLLQMKKYDDAIGAFMEGATVGTYPAMPYFNICTIYYNQKRNEEAVKACELAIQYDPTMADAYYVKGSILFGRGHLEHGTYVVPPGAVEALNKYLDLAPAGQHVRTVQEMLKQLNQKIETSSKPAHP
jgi:tetratricopeptide (TPR) repeat protein